MRCPPNLSCIAVVVSRIIARRFRVVTLGDEWGQYGCHHMTLFLLNLACFSREHEAAAELSFPHPSIDSKRREIKPCGEIREENPLFSCTQLGPWLLHVFLCPHSLIRAPIHLARSENKAGAAGAATRVVGAGGAICAVITSDCP